MENGNEMHRHNFFSLTSENVILLCSRLNPPRFEKLSVSVAPGCPIKFRGTLQKKKKSFSPRFYIRAIEKTSLERGTSKTRRMRVAEYRNRARSESKEEEE